MEVVWEFYTWCMVHGLIEDFVPVHFIAAIPIAMLLCMYTIQQLNFKSPTADSMCMCAHVCGTWACVPYTRACMLNSCTSLISCRCTCISYQQEWCQPFFKELGVETWFFFLSWWNDLVRWCLLVEMELSLYSCWWCTVHVIHMYVTQWILYIKKAQ